MIINKPQFDVDRIKLGEIAILKGKQELSCIIIEVSPLIITLGHYGSKQLRLTTTEVKIEEITSGKVNISFVNLDKVMRDSKDLEAIEDYMEDNDILKYNELSRVSEQVIEFMDNHIVKHTTKNQDFSSFK